MIIYDRSKKTSVIKNDKLLLRFLYNTFLGRCILKLLILKPISKFNGWLLRTKASKLIIKPFIKSNKIKMDDYPKIKYSSFNDFFERKIILEKRPIDLCSKNLISVADAKLSVYKISNKNKFTIKNGIYTIEELLKDSELAKKYKNGFVLVFRLDVTDYHHYIFMDDGKIKTNKHINGVLHTVMPISFKKYKTFCENDRNYNVLETKNFGEVVQMEVGALNVGKILNEDVLTFTKGMEKGHFAFGASTIILLLNNKVKIDQDILDNSLKNIETQVYLGEKIGKI